MIVLKKAVRTFVYIGAAELENAIMYDFDKITDRRNTDSIKWHKIYNSV